MSRPHLSDRRSAAHSGRVLRSVERLDDEPVAGRLRRLAFELNGTHTGHLTALSQRLHRISSELHEVAYHLDLQPDRSEPAVAAPGPEDDSLVIDLEAFEVRVGGQAFTLPFQEFFLLRTLVENRGRVLSRAQLTREAWDREPSPGERTIDVHIRRIRAKIEPVADRIRTVRRMGYRFD